MCISTNESFDEGIKRQKMKIEVKNLHVEIEGKEILKGITLSFEQGKTTAIMGPNGSGKSTLAHAIMGNPKCKVTKGKIMLNGKDITNKSPDVRARLGLFLAFQHPKEIIGVNTSTFMRSALNNIQEKKLNVIEFHKIMKKKMDELHIDESMKKRNLNEGFSGGEKKKMEILQLSFLQPKYAILDEIDSGLDVDALKIICKEVNKIRNKQKTGIMLITHYINMLKYIKPDYVHVMNKGIVVKSGAKEVAKEIEQNGFENLIRNVYITDK